MCQFFLGGGWGWGQGGWERRSEVFVKIPKKKNWGGGGEGVWGGRGGGYEELIYEIERLYL